MNLADLLNPYCEVTPITSQISSILTWCGMMNDDEDLLTVDDTVYLESKGFDLQRPYVWTDENYKAFISSMFNRGTAGTFAINAVRREDGGELIKIVDGKHRLKALTMFMNDELEVEGFRWSNMSKMDKRTFKGYKGNLYRIEKPMSDNDLINLYLAVNHPGVPQDENHLDYMRSQLS